MTKNIFKDDLNVADEIAKFVDTYFWAKTKAKIERIPYDTYEHKQMQRRGIDLIATSPNGMQIKIDEKAKISGLVNKEIEKTSVEIISWGNDGWFINEDNETDFYAFITISCDNSVEEEKDIRFENITEANYILINKKGLKKWLENEYELTADRLRNDAMDLLQYNVRKGNYIPKNNTNKPLYLTCSRKYSSIPVNLVLYMEDLLTHDFAAKIKINASKYQKIS